MIMRNGPLMGPHWEDMYGGGCEGGPCEVPTPKITSTIIESLWTCSVCGVQFQGPQENRPCGHGVKLERSCTCKNIGRWSEMIDSSKCELHQPIGYHTTEIKHGELGEISKIQEEVDELSDAHKQKVKILMLCEVADLIGAIEHYLEKYCPGFTIQDAQEMARLTKAHKEHEIR